MSAPPVIRPMGEAGLLVEFGTELDRHLHERVVALDAALAAASPLGLVETVPAYASLLLLFDPLQVEPAAFEGQVRKCLAEGGRELKGEEHLVPVSYDGPDLDAIAGRLGIGSQAVADLHAAAEYRVYMYGFAPGYAYLGGVPSALRLPRKPAPERGHPAGSVMIAGGQCLITTLPMPTGWWVIGSTPFRVLDPDGERPFRFAPGDRVRFERGPA